MSEEPKRWIKTIPQYHARRVDASGRTFPPDTRGPDPAFAVMGSRLAAEADEASIATGISAGCDRSARQSAAAQKAAQTTLDKVNPTLAFRLLAHQVVVAPT